MSALRTPIRDPSVGSDRRGRGLRIAVTRATIVAVGPGGWLAYRLLATEEPTAASAARSDIGAWLDADWGTTEDLRDERATLQGLGGEDSTRSYFATLSVFNPAIRSIDCPPLSASEMRRASAALLGPSNWYEALEMQGVLCAVEVESRLHDRVGATAQWEVTELVHGEGRILATSFDNSRPEARGGPGVTGAFEVLGALHRFAADEPGYASACSPDANIDGAACGEFLADHLDAFAEAYIPFSWETLTDELATGSPPAVITTAVQAVAEDDPAVLRAVSSPAFDPGVEFLRDELFPGDAPPASQELPEPTIHSCHTDPSVIGWRSSTDYRPQWHRWYVGLACTVTTPDGEHRMVAIISDGLISSLWIRPQPS